VITSILISILFSLLSLILGILQPFQYVAEILALGTSAIAEIAIYFSALPVVRLLLPYILIVIGVETTLIFWQFGKLLINFFRGSGIK